MRARRVRLAGAIFAIASNPAFAQHMGHGGMQMPMPPVPATAPQSTSGDTHRHRAHPKHEHGAQAVVAPAPSTLMPMPMEMPMGDMPGMRQALDAPRTPVPVLTDAARAAAVPPPGDHPVHDNPVETYTVFNRLEGWNADTGTGLHWEGASWIGTDLDRLWLRTEGERRDGRLDDADLEVLYGHSVSPWWDVLVGVRHDFRPGASQDFAAVGVQGLAPYKFGVTATAYVGEAGQASARVETDYDLLLTNRLIVQPLVEVNLYGRRDARRGIGAGLSTVETGLRLRYEVTRRFAPYVGIVQEHAFGETAELRRIDGEDSHETRIIAGVRLWF